MLTPQQNLARVQALTDKVLAHPMCAWAETRVDVIFVKYPAGFALGGAQCSLANGKAWALQRLLDAMERHWLESFPNPPTPGAP